MTADMLSNKNIQPIVTELLSKAKKEHFSCFRLNFTRYFILKIQEKEIQKSAINHLS